jgi:hypothetical protein
MFNSQIEEKFVRRASLSHSSRNFLSAAHKKRGRQRRNGRKRELAVRKTIPSHLLIGENKEEKREKISVKSVFYAICLKKIKK